LKFVFDLFPVVIFFGAYVGFDIYVATAALIGACFLQTLGYRWMQGSFEKMHLLTLVVAIIFGGATLILHDPNFIKAKPTLIYGSLSIAFLGSQFVGEKPLVKRMLGNALALPEASWSRLNLCWVSFFAFLAYANVFVAQRFSEIVWVNFKTFGDMILMVIFVVAQLIIFRRYLVDPELQEEGQDSAGDL
jgi:intracellular septation protein